MDGFQIAVKAGFKKWKVVGKTLIGRRFHKLAKEILEGWHQCGDLRRTTTAEVPIEQWGPCNVSTVLKGIEPIDENCIINIMDSSSMNYLDEVEWRTRITRPIWELYMSWKKRWGFQREKYLLHLDKSTETRPILCVSIQACVLLASNAIRLWLHLQLSL